MSSAIYRDKSLVKAVYQYGIATCFVGAMEREFSGGGILIKMN